ncbi:MAG: nicotinate-nicotinamide nucleotide adenylyltransferase [Thermoleophilia bacterium]|nr:nicotinate-nicotinamide nucleotide adenylyltransferase [Thermoleophilia bacterium]
MIGLFGGAFDPPHNGHVALVHAAVAHFGLERVIVLASERPGHRSVVAPAEARLRLAGAAFPGCDVELDPHPRTIDLLRAREFGDAILLIGADQFRDFPAWKEPEAILERVRLGVATRPGVAVQGVPGVSFFEIEPVPVSGTMIRARCARGESLAGLVPPEVEELIAELGVYRGE